MRWLCLDQWRHGSVQEKWWWIKHIVPHNRKRRVSIKDDGHCLPRFIFRGAKALNLLPEFIKYSQLLEAAINDIKTYMDNYRSISESEILNANEVLDIYVTSKTYSTQLNIIDTLITSLAKMTRCTIRMHYQGIDGSFSQYEYLPGDEHSSGEWDHK